MVAIVDRRVHFPAASNETDAKNDASAAQSDAVFIRNSRESHDICGYFKIEKSDFSHSGHFNGDIAIYGIVTNEDGDSNNKFRKVGNIHIGDYLTDIDAYASEGEKGHDEVKAKMWGGIRKDTNAVLSNDADTNIVYQMARAVAENTTIDTATDRENATKIITGWLKKFEETLRPRIPESQIFPGVPFS